MATFDEIDVSEHSHRKWKKDDLLRLITVLWEQQDAYTKMNMELKKEFRLQESALRAAKIRNESLAQANDRLRARIRNERNAFKSVEDAVSKVRAEYFRNSPEEAAARRQQLKVLRHGENYKQGDLL